MRVRNSKADIDKKTVRAHENVMAKHVALPDPPEPVVAHLPDALAIVARMCHDLERTELEKVPPGLLGEKRPRYVEERCDARVAYEVGHVRVPTHPTHEHVKAC